MNWKCIDCDINTKEIGDYYEVKPSVWPKETTRRMLQNRTTGQILQTVITDSRPVRGCLCIPCLERRLERTLTPDDFTDSKRNIYGTKSQMLAARLEGQGTV